MPEQEGPACVEACKATFDSTFAIAQAAWQASDHSEAALTAFIDACATALNDLSECLEAC